MKLTTTAILCFFALCITAQKPMPTLKTNTAVLSIKDGEVFKKDDWTVSPKYPLDIYTADKTSRTKTVTFYSDIDSISFEVKPLDKHDFVVVLNGKDSCFHRIESGITFQRTADMEYTTDTIPFTLTAANNISIQAVINKVDTVNLMFHTDANSVGLIEEATKNMSSLIFDKSSSGAKSWGGNDGSMRISDGNGLQIGNFTWEDVRLWEGKRSGPGTDGKFGPTLFQNKVIEINFDHRVLVIHSLPPELEKEYEKIDISFKQHSMFIDGTSIINGVDYKNNFLIHSGYSGAVLLDDVFVNENKFNDKLEITSESQLTDSFGNILKTKKAILPNFKLGDVVFSNSPVTFFDGAIGRQKMSVLGGEILKRFNIILDLQNAYLFLRPNNLFDSEFSG